MLFVRLAKEVSSRCGFRQLVFMPASIQTSIYNFTKGLTKNQAKQNISIAFQFFKCLTLRTRFPYPRSGSQGSGGRRLHHRRQRSNFSFSFLWRGTGETYIFVHILPTFRLAEGLEKSTSLITSRELFTVWGGGADIFILADFLPTFYRERKGRG